VRRKNMVKIGDRVGAIRNADSTTVYLYGFGEYMGEEVPTRGFLSEIGIKNPAIKLDNGQIVYGFECWWGSEVEIKEMIGNRTVVIVPVEAPCFENK